MSLRDIMAQIVTLEEGLSISVPIAVSGSQIRAYKVAPARNKAISEKITFMNWPDAVSELRLGTTREDQLSIQIDCLVNDSDFDQGADIALAFFDAVWKAFDDEKESARRLGGTISHINLRAERPALESIEWAGKSFPGFHIFLDLTLFEEGL